MAELCKVHSYFLTSDTSRVTAASALPITKHRFPQTLWGSMALSNRGALMNRTSLPGRAKVLAKVRPMQSIAVTECPFGGVGSS